MTSQTSGKAKQCVCGHSSHFPVCDGSHVSEGWTCVATSVEMVRDAFLATPNLSNLADRLAHRFRGTSLHAIDGPVRAKCLIILTDGVGIEAIESQRRRTHAEETLVIGIGIEAKALSWAISGTEITTIPSSPETTLWDRAQAVIEDGDPKIVEDVARPRVFVSHGVADEALIFPALTTLRQEYGLELFVCADSIDPGADWQAEIRSSLRGCDLFLLLSSSVVASSVFCAFEPGMAIALEKTVRVINLDGSTLPIHLRGVQAIDVPRLLGRKPWLTSSDGVLDACLAAITA